MSGITQIADPVDVEREITEQLERFTAERPDQTIIKRGVLQFSVTFTLTEGTTIDDATFNEVGDTVNSIMDEASFLITQLVDEIDPRHKPQMSLQYGMGVLAVHPK